MTVFDDPRVKRYAWTTDEGYDVEMPGDVWAVVPRDDAWWACRYRDRDNAADLGPFDTAEAAIKAVFEQ